MAAVGKVVRRLPPRLAIGSTPALGSEFPGACGLSGKYREWLVSEGRVRAVPLHARRTTIRQPAVELHTERHGDGNQPPTNTASMHFDHH